MENVLVPTASISQAANARIVKPAARPAWTVILVKPAPAELLKMAAAVLLANLAAQSA